MPEISLRESCFLLWSRSCLSSAPVVFRLVLFGNSALRLGVLGFRLGTKESGLLFHRVRAVLIDFVKERGVTAFRE